MSGVLLRLPSKSEIKYSVKLTTTCNFYNLMLVIGGSVIQAPLYLSASPPPLQLTSSSGVTKRLRFIPSHLVASKEAVEVWACLHS